MANSEPPTAGTQAVPAHIVNAHRRAFGDEDTFRIALESIADEVPEDWRPLDRRKHIVQIINIARLALNLPTIH